ncbi:hypothetical protein GQ600_12421 [Phytophthora cactorum]|nr:hypothetical protein GQ600_12421 [Phytophthora cactorum]
MTQGGEICRNRFHAHAPKSLAPVRRRFGQVLKKEVSAIQTLTAKYGDEILYKMIEDAKVAIRKDPDEVFHLFKLDKVRRDILSNSDFTDWVKYVDDLNAKHPEEPKFVVDR